MRPSKLRAAARGIRAKVASPTKSATTLCHNLRAEHLPTGETVLRPVGRPLTLADGNWRPLTLMSPVAGMQLVIVADGCNLAAIDVTDRDDDLAVLSSDNIVPIAVTDSEITCGLALGSMLTVMTAEGPRRLCYADDLQSWMLIEPSEWTALSLVAVEAADCTATVASRKLSDAYTAPSMQLNDADRRAVSADLRRAYSEVAAQAAASGSYCAPALMRYRLVGHDGSELFLSPPLLLGASDSARLTAPVEVTSADRRTLDSYDISALSWRPAVIGSGTVGKAMAAAVSRIELLACPQFHPFDPSGDAIVNLVNAAADNTMLRLTMPGAGRSVSSGNAAVGESRLRRMMAVQPEAERVVAVIQGPFAEGSRIDSRPTLTLPYTDVADECAAVERALSLKPQTLTDSFMRVARPHRFAASCVASAAGRVIWGSLRALRFGGYTADFFAGRRAAAGSWHSAVSVTFASGDEQVVAVAQGTEGAPEAFNPVLSYPSADAVAMTLIVSSGGRVRRMTVPLSPLPSGDMAVYVDPSFAPFELTGEAQAFVVPAERRVERPMPGFVAEALAASPESAVSLAAVADGEVMALFPTGRSLSSWDFARPRFSALTTRGVCSVTLSQGRPPAVSLIDTRAVVSRHAAVDADGRIFAVASGSLVEVGASRLKTLLTDVGADVLAYDAVRNELWLSGGGLSKIVDLSTLDSTTRDELAECASVGPYALVDGKLCRLDRETPQQSVYARWDCRLALAQQFVRPVAVNVDLRSKSLTYGSVALKRMSTADEAPLPELRFTVSGAVGSPLRMPLVAVPLRRATFSLQGRLSPDSMISSVELEYINV